MEAVFWWRHLLSKTRCADGVDLHRPCMQRVLDGQHSVRMEREANEAVYEGKGVEDYI
jgi:hypothetical protein